MVSLRQIAFVAVMAYVVYSFFMGPPDLNPRHDPMFIKFPAVGKLKLKNGYVSDMPFHIYDSDSTGISGYADYDKVVKLLRDQEGWNENSQFEVAPVVNHLTNRTSAMVTFMIVKYYDTVVGAYDEVAFTFAAKYRNKKLPVHKCKSFVCPLTLITNPNYLQKSLKLYVSQQDTYHYGREYLAFNKEVVNCNIDRPKNGIGHISAHFSNPKNTNQNDFVAKIDLKRDIVVDLLLLPRLLLEGEFSFVLSSVFDMLFKRIQLLNLIGARNVHNNPIFKETDPVVLAMLKSDILVNHWNPNTNSLELSGDFYGDLNFQPVTVIDQRSSKMIFFEPQNGGNVAK